MSENEVLVASTGIIGKPLPIGIVENGIVRAAASLSRSPDAAHNSARAIITTDTRTKEAQISFAIGASRVRIGAVAKGAGMIAPHLATMLVFLTTDAVIGRAALSASLKDACRDSFNCLTVDGHTSTNDSVLMLANGRALNRSIGPAGAARRKFQAALAELCQHLARSIASDGEGATKLVEVRVSSAPNTAAARKVARAIAESPLVKTAIFGEDPNWGRIISAAGFASGLIREDLMSLGVNGVRLFRKGRPLTDPRTSGSARQAMKKPVIRIELDLGLGSDSAKFWTCDFSCDYVRINARYHT